ncbi:hypothetical protein DPM13_15060 [Paracoccus mutanolyticus]|uniref:Transposase for insertion sequence element IS21-like C-terminal domain-containing protein n=1 Tax=Paracoccus mutanolyticus TaxID=1499308 RepID=A0ABN5MCA3_9RHOB|nr:hypothetical protein DPM13_15060 [Paracoccus mutanolyticus]
MRRVRAVSLIEDRDAKAPLDKAPARATARCYARTSHAIARGRNSTADLSTTRRAPPRHQDVWIRAYMHEVVIGSRGEVIARHPRCCAGRGG